MRSRQGLSIIEIVVVIAVLGGLFAVGAVFIDATRFQTNQAASALANNIRRVRFEAIRSNASAFIDFDTSSAGSYELWVDTSGDGAKDASEVVQTVTFGSGDVAGVVLTEAPTRIGFDRRGLPVALTTGTISLQSARNAAYVRTVDYFLGDVSVD